MTQITRVPIGLQKFLGTQAQGDNPSELGNIVQPGVDLYDFYRVQQERWSEVSSLFSAATILYETVPDGEIWILRSVGIRHYGGGAGGSYTSSIYMDKVPNSQAPSSGHPLAGPYTFTDTATAPNIWTSTELNDVVAYSGSRIAFEFVNVTGVNHTPKGYCRYIKLEQ